MALPGITYTDVRRLWQRFIRGYRRLTTRFTALIRTGSAVLDVITFLASVACLTILTLLFGFERSALEVDSLHHCMRVIQGVFIVNILYNLLLDFRNTVRQTRVIKWIVEGLVLVTLLPLLYPHPENPWIPWLEHIAYSRPLLYLALGAYAFVDFSFGILKLLGRHTNPSLILAGSFFVLVIIGSLLLMMPRCTVVPIDYIDSLFVSTSAVCITGLTTLDVSQTFTPTGLMVLALMIQVGGVGVITFTSFFALFFSGNTSIYSQLMVKDMIYSKTINSLLPTLIYILTFTLAIEAVGAAAIFLTVHGTLDMSVHDEVVFSAFHALSAFCNAGFSNVEGGLSNPALLKSNQIVYVVIAILVIAGGIGFPILVNFYQAGRRKLSILWHRVTGRAIRGRKAHLLDLNTRIVLVTTAWLLALSAMAFFIFEYDNTLAGMSLWEKTAQSFFNATVPRSSGFSSVNPARFLDVTVIMFILLMWIGGASQSTAGGIKVNTFAVMLLNLKAVILGRDRVTAHNRTIARGSIRMAHAVISLSIVAFFVVTITLVGLEPHLPVKALVYESTSALFTVGTSLGITSDLSTPSKGLLCVAMYFGRVGLISLLVGVVGRHNDPPVILPDENIIIN